MISVYFHKDAFFKSKHSLADSILRLSACVKPNRPLERLKGGLFGSVDHSKVLLWHLNPPHPYSGSIWFRGSFVEKNGYTELSGRFETPKPTRFLLNALLIVSILSLLFLYLYEMSESARLDLLILPFVLLVIWVVMVFCFRRGKTFDIEYISKMIETAFE